MEGKIEELEQVRTEVEKLQASDENFTNKLMQLLDRTTSQLSEVDDQQEINWTAKSFDILMDIRNQKVQENETDQKDLALTYLKEALDSVIIREKNYLK
jgi:malonyl CoA-acyl carrier protein transacylase